MSSRSLKSRNRIEVWVTFVLVSSAQCNLPVIMVIGFWIHEMCMFCLLSMDSINKLRVKSLLIACSTGIDWWSRMWSSQHASHHVMHVGAVFMVYYDVVGRIWKQFLPGHGSLLIGPFQAFTLLQVWYMDWCILWFHDSSWTKEHCVQSFCVLVSCCWSSESTCMLQTNH
jgi:hypothetical protein